MTSTGGMSSDLTALLSTLVATDSVNPALVPGGAGIPTLLFGPAGEGAHGIDEWVSLSSAEAVAHTLIGLAARFCA